MFEDRYEWLKSIKAELLKEFSDKIDRLTEHDLEVRWLVDVPKGYECYIDVPLHEGTNVTFRCTYNREKDETFVDVDKRRRTIFYRRSYGDV